MEPPGILVDIGGRRLHAMVDGERGPTVVIESGGGGGAAMQDLPVQRLVAGFARCIVYDRAGLGWSDPAPGFRSLDAMVNDLHALLNALCEAGPVVLVGASFGGLVARAFARRHPARVSGMVLVDTADEQKYVATMPAFRPALEAELAEAAANARDTARHFLNSIRELEVLDHPPLTERRWEGLENLGDLPLIVLRHTIPYAGGYAVWEDGWEAAQQRLAALSTRSALIAARGCGHAISLENPGLVAAAIQAVVACARGGVFNLRDVEAAASSRA